MCYKSHRGRPRGAESVIVSRVRLLPALVLTALVALSVSAGAAALLSLTLAELVGGSDLIAEGRVVSTKCVRPRPAGLIYTDVELEVTAVHKGVAAERLRV